jgi:hypothetical protein
MDEIIAQAAVDPLLKGPMAMDDWVAERVEGEKVKNGIRYFLVEWDSGDSKRTTYEAESALTSCRPLIDDFHQSKATQPPPKPHQPVSGSDTEQSPPPSPKRNEMPAKGPPPQISSVIGVSFEGGQCRFAVTLTDGRAADATRSELLTANTAAYVAFLEHLASNS